MKHLIWLDLETTGLDPQKDKILEVAMSVADWHSPFQLREPSYQSALYLSRVPVETDPFIREMHTKNGLWDACLSSSTFLTEAEDKMIGIIEALGPVEEKDDKPIIAGSTIHFDKSFLKIHMPRFEALLSHRLYDVSTIKLFCQSMGMEKPPKAEAHRAIDDIRESVAHGKMCAKFLRVL